jgi:hypothetical protein
MNPTTTFPPDVIEDLLQGRLTALHEALWSPTKQTEQFPWTRLLVWIGEQEQQLRRRRQREAADTAWEMVRALFQTTEIVAREAYCWGWRDAHVLKAWAGDRVTSYPSVVRVEEWGRAGGRP